MEEMRYCMRERLSPKCNISWLWIMRSWDVRSRKPVEFCLVLHALAEICHTERTISRSTDSFEF